MIELLGVWRSHEKVDGGIGFTCSRWKWIGGRAQRVKMYVVSESPEELMKLVDHYVFKRFPKSSRSVYVDKVRVLYDGTAVLYCNTANIMWGEP